MNRVQDDQMERLEEREEEAYRSESEAPRSGSAVRSVSRLWDRLSFSGPSPTAHPPASPPPAPSSASSLSDFSIAGPTTPTPKPRTSSFPFFGSASSSSSASASTPSGSQETVVPRRSPSSAAPMALRSWSGKLKALPLWSDKKGKDRGEDPFAESAGEMNGNGKGKERESFEVLDGVGEDEIDSDEPLDGEEGEVVYDEACFPGDLEGKIDFLASLPHEISLSILLHLELHALLAASQVSNHWRALALDNLVWRDLFAKEARWQLRPAPPSATTPLTQNQLSPPRLKRAASSNAPVSGAKRGATGSDNTPVATPKRVARKLMETMADFGGLSLSPSAPRTPPPSSPSMSRAPSYTGMTSSAILNSSLNWSHVPPADDWLKLYHDRYVLERRWAKGKPQTAVLKGHTDGVYCLQFDETKVVSGSRDRTIRIWDLPSLTCTHTLTGHAGSILCLQYDDNILVTGSSDCRILVWDLVGERKMTWKMALVGHNMGVLDLCFNEKVIVSCSKDTTIRVWDRATGSVIRILSGHGGPVNAVQLFGNKILSASGDALIKLWDYTTGEVLRVFTGHERGLACVQFSPSGKLIVSGSNDRLVKVWDAETGVCLRTMEGHTDLVRSLALDENARRVVSASYDKTLRVWDLDTGELLLRFRAHTSLVFDVALSASKILSCSHDQKIMILDFGSGLDTSRFV